MPENNATPKTYDSLGNTLEIPANYRISHAVRDLSGATLHDSDSASKPKTTCRACYEANAHPTERKTTIKWKDVPAPTPNIVAGLNTHTPTAAELEHTTDPLPRLIDIDTLPAVVAKNQSKQAPSPRPWPGFGTNDLFDLEGLPNDRNPFSITSSQENDRALNIVHGSDIQSKDKDGPQDSKIFGDDVGNRSRDLNPQRGNVTVDSGALSDVKYSNGNTWITLGNPGRIKAPPGFEDGPKYKGKNQANHGASSPESTLRTYSWSPPLRPRVVSAPAIKYVAALLSTPAPIQPKADVG
jgi:hypothetical protein